MYQTHKVLIKNPVVLGRINKFIIDRSITNGLSVAMSDHQYLINEKRFMEWEKLKHKSTEYNKETGRLINKTELVFHNFEDHYQLDDILEGNVDISKKLTKWLNFKKNKQFENTVICEIINNDDVNLDTLSDDQTFEVNSNVLYPKFFVKTSICENANDDDSLSNLYRKLNSCENIEFLKNIY